MHMLFLHKAIELARINVAKNAGGPFGALIVKDNTIIAEGVNIVTASNDPTAHAEIVAIRQACQKLGSFQLTGCTLYASCEPCPMCLSALYWARPAGLYFAATRHDAAKAGFDDAFIYNELKVPLEDRQLVTVVLDHPEAQIPFSEWEKSQNKTAY